MSKIRYKKILMTKQQHGKLDVHSGIVKKQKRVLGIWFSTEKWYFKQLNNENKMTYNKGWLCYVVSKTVVIDCMNKFVLIQQSSDKRYEEYLMDSPKQKIKKESV